ncbi:unnamed protein product [Sphagnum jensenii]|uniref:Lissencephaly-1 homolog n=1 Tax=Sphagnum jensenii TaxID=128206 RepID=A0ABP0VG34_9BRYO
MVLTERQKKDINEAILEYLISEGDTFKKTIEYFKIESQLNGFVTSEKGLLEKKWTSVVRLQKKVMDLEAMVASHPMKSNDQPSTALQTESKYLPVVPVKSVLVGHRGPVTSIAVHPLYTLMATGSEDTIIKIWDYDSAQCERSLKGHTGPVTGLCYDSSGNFLASCSADMSAKIWDMCSFSCIKTLRGHDHSISSIRYSINNECLYTCSRDQSIKCWETSSGFCVKTLLGHTDWVKCIAVSLDGSLLASGGSDHYVIVWRLAGGQILQTLRGHEHVVESVCFGKRPADGSAIVSRSIFSNSNSNNTINGSSNNNNVTISQESDYLVSGSRDKSIRLWDVLSGNCLTILSSHDSWVRAVLVTPSGKYIISSSDDKSIRIFDVKEQRQLRNVADAHTHFVTCLALSVKNNTLVSGSVDKNVHVWTCS